MGTMELPSKTYSTQYPLIDCDCVQPMSYCHFNFKSKLFSDFIVQHIHLVECQQDVVIYKSIVS